MREFECNERFLGKLLVEQGSVQYASSGKTFYLRFCGDVRLPWCASFESFCEQALSRIGYTSMVIDLNSAENLDSTTLGTLAKVALYATRVEKQKPKLYCVDESLTRLIDSMGLQNLLDVYRTSVDAELDYQPIDLQPIEEDDMQEVVISAHEQLMAIEEKNRLRFESLVNTLRAQCGDNDAESS